MASVLDQLWQQVISENMHGGGRVKKNKIWCGAGVYILSVQSVRGRKDKVPCVLVLRERNRSALSGVDVWDEPGGKLEPYMDTIAEGASTELLEESRNWLYISPEILHQTKEKNFFTIWSKGKTAIKGYRVYIIRIEGLLKKDYLQNMRLLDKQGLKGEVPPAWLETDGLTWVPLSEFQKKNLPRARRKSWRGNKENRAVVQDVFGRKIEVGGRLVLGLRNKKNYQLAQKISKQSQWHRTDFQSITIKKGFLKGTKQYRLT